MSDAAPHSPSFRNLLWCRSASTGLPTIAPSKVDAQLLVVLVLIGGGAGAARIDDFLVPRFDLGHVARQLAARVPQIDLERERVEPRLVLQYPLQRRVGNETAVPIILAVDFGGGKAGRQ